MEEQTSNNRPHRRGEWVLTKLAVPFLLNLQHHVERRQLNPKYYYFYLLIIIVELLCGQVCATASACAQVSVSACTITLK